MKPVGGLLIVLLAMPCVAAEIPVADVAAFAPALARARPGDVLSLQPGEWKDADLVFRGAGTADRPITLWGNGQVRFTGKSRLRIAGEHLVVEGLWFDDCTPPKSEIISLREDSKRLAHRCVIRQCAITQSSALVDTGDRKWVSIYGVGHRLENCHFQGKTSGGTLLIVWLPTQPGEPPRHRIANNYFGPRPRLGKNGGEIIRIGDSDTSMQSAECVVEQNLFEKCDGEVECISNKSCGNIYRGNVFIECQGSLTLRHGNGCLVEKNVFLGNGRKSTGGIRVIGEDHRVVGNHLDSLQGDDARAAICLMNAIENSPLNGYFQVKRATIAGNVVVDCKQSIVIGYADEDVTAKLPPIDCVFDGNVVWAGKGKAIDLIDATASLAWKNNRMVAPSLGIAPINGVSTNAMDRPKPPAVPDVKAFGCSWLKSTPPEQTAK